MSIHVFGIRHHGPGCAHSLRQALDDLSPDLVLVEGPPDCVDIIPLAARSDMKPPVSLLVHAAAEPGLAVFYPFTTFSPEWQAIQWSLKKNRIVRFMDLPYAYRFCEKNGLMEAEGRNSNNASDDPEKSHPDLKNDPLGVLANAAGYSDRELWWEHQVEQRKDSTGIFEGILEAMTALREETEQDSRIEQLREAFMRKTIRACGKEGFTRIAVVCGAWHAPVLAELGPAKKDNALLKGLSKARVSCTWIPWTNSRLSYHSGYGAGVDSPAWYEQVWKHEEKATLRWLSYAARLLREEDYDAPSASVIEAYRLVETLAALRQIPLPGLAEAKEAIQSVFLQGDPIPMVLVRNKLEIGDRLGSVPEETPSVPLQVDLARLQKRLRIKPSTAIKELKLDLRKEIHLERSRLFHRLGILGIPWAQMLAAAGDQGTGTFNEIWRLQWQPEFAVSLIEANVWGNTIDTAATKRFIHESGKADLPQLTDMLLAVLPANLPTAVEQLLNEVQARAAVTDDVLMLMQALPPLANVVRYSDVRGTETSIVTPILEGLFERALISLPGACYSLDDEAATSMVEGVEAVHGAVMLLELENMYKSWLDALVPLSSLESAHGLVRGKACRLLFDLSAIDDEDLCRRTRLALTLAVNTEDAAAWIEGLLRGSSHLLLHQVGVWEALNEWLCQLPGDRFASLLPLLRRAFSNFSKPERRNMGNVVKNLNSIQTERQTVQKAWNIDSDRAAKTLPVLAQILGVTYSRRSS